ncbi:unnamed protein product [Darwinula stevensoni]|uniref:Uncharacterized protein n=1 Tax=Darwinula stevensoni TaxID=69355 RepID=A0A7R8XEJ4_9CRUS|nr:unnamed protein product [Darwinula stevensoni]CAG0894523.1 unnamed protein product [Darwinula stevensoni]
MRNREEEAGNDFRCPRERERESVRFPGPEGSKAAGPPVPASRLICLHRRLLIFLSGGDGGELGWGGGELGWVEGSSDGWRGALMGGGEFGWGGGEFGWGGGARGRDGDEGEGGRRPGEMKRGGRWSWLLLSLVCLVGAAGGSPEAKRLYDDLLSTYNRLIRPVGNSSDRLTVKMGLRLSQLIDVNLKNQIMTTNMWVEQEWHDYKLKWDPEDYGGVKTLYVPSETIWLPDIVLYNNADGNYEVTIMTKAVLHHSGKVTWKPPAIYKSSCEIDVEYFPFDEQTCSLKFGSWTYDGYLVDLRHIKQEPNSNYIDYGIDLGEYYLSVEWDIMKVPATRNEKYYSCCEEPYPERWKVRSGKSMAERESDDCAHSYSPSHNHQRRNFPKAGMCKESSRFMLQEGNQCNAYFGDIRFNITLRRKTLFYTVNLIIPCVGISFLSVLVFYLPSDSGEKVSLCISILLSLTVFFLLLAEIIPPTSLTVPLLGKYLLFTMTLVTFSVMATIGVLNVNFRSPSTHRMSPWVKTLFIDFLPRILCMRRPDSEEHARRLSIELKEARRFEKGGFHTWDIRMHAVAGSHFTFSLPSADGTGDRPTSTSFFPPSSMDLSPIRERRHAPEVERAISSVQFIAQHMKNMDRFSNIVEDWKYVAMVLDRLFLWLFTIACVAGTAAIILSAPSLWDTRRPIDIKYSKLAQRRFRHLLPEEDWV